MGLRCCTRAFSSCGKRGLLFVAVRGFSLQWLLLLRSRGSRRAGFSTCGSRALQCRLSSCGARALVAPRHVGSSRTRDRTRVPCIGRWILNHCTTREVRHSNFKRLISLDVWFETEFSFKISFGTFKKTGL